MRKAKPGDAAQIEFQRQAIREDMGLTPRKTIYTENKKLFPKTK